MTETSSSEIQVSIPEECGASCECDVSDCSNGKCKAPCMWKPGHADKHMCRPCVEGDF